MEECIEKESTGKIWKEMEDYRNRLVDVENRLCLPRWEGIVGGMNCCLGGPSMITGSFKREPRGSEAGEEV